MTHFIHMLGHYAWEILPALAVGFFISGLVHELIPENLVEKYLGSSGIKPIFMATLVGAILPVCCWGSLPIAVSFHKKGAKLGPILAFLVATPATSISALMVTYSVLGFDWALYSFFAGIVMGVVMGIIGNLVSLRKTADGVILREAKGRPKDLESRSFASRHKYNGGTSSLRMTEKEECPHCKHETIEKKRGTGQGANKSVPERLVSILTYAFITLPREIGFELLLGLVLAAVVATFVPIGQAIHTYLEGWAAYAFSVIFGIVMYLCATASVPLIDSLVAQGLAKGAGMTLLLIGPITSYGTILVLRKEFGLRTVAIFLAGLVALTLLLGVGFSMI